MTLNGAASAGVGVQGIDLQRSMRELDGRKAWESQ